MAKREDFSLSLSQRRRRTFSENFKREKVREIELGLIRVSELCRQFEVSSVSVYRWLDNYGTMKEKKERLIVESQSDIRQLLELKKQVAELERKLGQKQILIDFQQKMIELAEDHYGVDIKKKFSGSPSATSGNTES